MLLEVGNWCTGVCDWRGVRLMLGNLMGLLHLVTRIHAFVGFFFLFFWLGKSKRFMAFSLPGFMLLAVQFLTD